MYSKWYLNPQQRSQVASLDLKKLTDIKEEKEQE